MRARKCFVFSFSLPSLSLSTSLTREVGRHLGRRDVLRGRAVLGAVGCVQSVGRGGAAADGAADAGGGCRGGRESGVDDVSDRRRSGLLALLNRKRRRKKEKK